MEQFYKGHRIEVSVWLDGDGWCASLFIYYSEGPQNILVTFAVPDTFKTYDGAIEAGLAAAQKWIDGGKPAIQNFMPSAFPEGTPDVGTVAGADMYR